jgi:hypothetical protein
MRYGFGASDLPRLGLAVTTMCIGCSDAPKGSAIAATLSAASTLTPQATSTAVSTSSSKADGGAGSVWPDYSWVAAIHVSPWTQCNIYPEGAGNDATRTSVIQAQDDGVVRFSCRPPAGERN